MANATVDAQDIPKLIKNLAEETSSTEAGNELFAIGGPALPHLLDALSSSDVKIRRGAMTIFSGILSFNTQAMMEIGSAPTRIPPMVKTMLEALADTDAEVRSGAASSIASLSTLAPAELFNNNITPLLLKTLQDEIEKVRIGVANAIVGLPDYRPIPIKHLQESLADEAAEVRERIAWAIWEQVPEKKEQSCPDCAGAIPYLSNLLKDPDRKVRHTAAMAIGAINPNDYDAIPVLLDAISAELLQENSLGFARSSLKRMEENSQKSIIPILEEFLNHQDPAMKRAAAMAIKYIKGE